MRLEQAEAAAMSLPGVAVAPHHELVSFRVGGRIFMTVPPGGGHIHVFIGEDDRLEAIRKHGECVEDLRWGGKSVGVRIHLAKARAPFVRKLIHAARDFKARPRR